MRLLINDFSKGLWVVSGKETTLPGFVRRNTGVHELRTPSMRSRVGSTLIALKNNINSIHGFNNQVYFSDTAQDFFRHTTGTSSISLITGMNPNSLSYIHMPPQPGLNDYLFLIGAGVGKKITTADVVSNWGIAAPGSNPSAADNGAGALSAGTYRYYVTFLNSTTGSRSNPNSTPASVTLGASRQVLLSSVPTSADAQVTRREIFRTLANGARYFKIGEIANNSGTTFADNIADTSASVLSQEVQFDNAPPTADFQLTWGPLHQRVWWAESLGGSVPQGRAYYSPPGRPESMAGFIEVCAPSEGIQRGVIWNRRNWIVTQQRFFLVDGDDEPFEAIPLDHVPGTISDMSVVSTPFGIVYRAYDGIRLFDGMNSQLVGFEPIATAFRGEATDGVGASFFGVNDAAFWRNEYVVEIGGQTLALNLQTGTWRNLGISLFSLHRQLGDITSTRLLGSINGDNVYSIEDLFAGTLDDDQAIPIDWEIGGALTDIGHFGTVQRAYFDINTANKAIAANIICDGIQIFLGVIATASRQLVEFPVPSNWKTRVFSLRLTATVDARIELFGAAVDVKIEGSNTELGAG